MIVCQLRPAVPGATRAEPRHLGTGPVVGALLEYFWWGSVFLALVPVALVAAVLAFEVIPESSDPAAARIDLPGLATSSAAIGLLVYTIIEAPVHGWLAPWTIAGFAGTAVLVAAFVAVERRRENPKLDVTLFRTPAFSAASGAVTVAFFALFGLIFLITQYFQFSLSDAFRADPVRRYMLPLASDRDPTWPSHPFATRDTPS